MTGTYKPTDHLLLLAGSGESRAIAQALAQRAGGEVTASLLYPSRTHGPLPVPTRLGRFGGEAGLAQFLRDEQITAVLDATHPFANQISGRAARVCAQLQVPYALVLRPQWQAEPGDPWTEVADEAAVGDLLSPGQRVFTTTGRATLERLVHGSDAQFLVRQLENRAPSDTMPNVQYIAGKGPFSVADEMENLTRLNIDVLVAKNSGGLPSRTKLDAARALGIPVILIARPTPPADVLILETVTAALDWVDQL